MNGLPNGSTTLPEFAGQTCRFAHVWLEMENRSPIEITDINYSKYTFDEQGSIRRSLIEGAGAAFNRQPLRGRQRHKRQSNILSFPNVRAERTFQQHRWEAGGALDDVFDGAWRRRGLVLGECNDPGGVGRLRIGRGRGGVCCHGCLSSNYRDFGLRWFLVSHRNHLRGCSVIVLRTIDGPPLGGRRPSVMYHPRSPSVLWS